MVPETEYEAEPIVAQHLRNTVPDSTDPAGTKRPGYKPISEARRTTPSFTPLKLQYQAEPKI